MTPKPPSSSVPDPGTRILDPGEMAQILAEPTTGAPAHQTLGPYELLDRAGEGGMGIVYRARHRELNKIVALKVLKEGLHSSVSLERFRREASLTASLDVPNVVPVHDLGSEAGRHYLAMKWIDGCTFENYLTSIPGGSRAQAGAVVRLLLPAIQALGRAHRAGIIHRDVKPANLLIDRSGTAWLSDFGLARCKEVTGEFTAPGLVVGTPAYMPPEQARGETDRLGPPADVFAMGATLYAAFGGPPREVDDPGIAVRRIAEEELSPLRSRWPDVPRDLETIIARAMAREPERRYADAAALADDLERWLDGRPIGARPPGFTDFVRRKMRRHWAAVAVACAAAAAVLGIAIAVIGRRQDEDLRRTESATRAEAAARQARALERERRLPEARAAYLSGAGIDPTRLDLRRAADRLGGEIEQDVQASLAAARRALDQGDASAAREQLGRIEMFAGEREEFRRLAAMVVVKTGTIVVEDGGVQVTVIPVDADTLAIAGQSVREARAPCTWTGVPLGAYLLEFATAGHWSARMRLVVSPPTPDAAGGNRRVVAVPALPVERSTLTGMVLCGGGPCVLGGDALGGLPERTMNLPAFLIDAREVTHAEYAEAVHAGCVPPLPGWAGVDPPEALRGLPVTMVSWAEADAFARFKGKRLPTEDEWERAGRWFDGRPFPWGRRWSEGQANTGGRGHTLQSPGSFPTDRSPDGVLDLAGNVLEWTSTPAPNSLTRPAFVVRGCAFAMQCRLEPYLLEHLATRRFEGATARREFLGFRCALGPEETKALLEPAREGD